MPGSVTLSIILIATSLGSAKHRLRGPAGANTCLGGIKPNTDARIDYTVTSAQ